jgi:dienelactone hydrolase
MGCRTFKVLTVVSCLVAGATARAEIKTQVVEYKAGDATLEGYLAYDDAVKGPRPGVLVAHAWMGLDDYAKRRARELAGLGYTAFALDIYGKGVRPKTREEAGALAGKYKAGDRATMRSRALAGFNMLAQDSHVDHQRLGAIGYCFGGTTVLELARSGAALGGVVSFHGGLDTQRPEDARNIKGKIFVMTGGDDPSVPPKQVEGFEDEMRKAKVDWQLIAFGNAVHAFTDPGAGNDPSKGAAYNERADKRSFADMVSFFKEVFGS